MSERTHDRISKHYLSPSHNAALKKPAMRMSPRKATSPQTYRMPPKRLESPEILKRYQQRVQDKSETPSYFQNTEYNMAVNSGTSYTSPLKPRHQDNDISSSYPQLIPETNRIRSPRRDVPIDSSPIRGKNIISKLKQEMSMIEALDKSPKTKREKETRKSVRFDIPLGTQRNANNTAVKDEKPSIKSELTAKPIPTDYVQDIKGMLQTIIKKQENQELLLKEVLQRQDQLERQLPHK